MAAENTQRIIQMRGTKTACEAFTAALEEASIAYATDTNEFGIYTNGAFVWISATAVLFTGHEHVYQEDLSARCNGSTTLFYTANAYEADTTQVWINGVLQRPITQYTEDTSSYDTLMLNSAPFAGDEFIVAYTMATA